MSTAWNARLLAGTVADLHARPVASGAGREVVLCQARGPALVLGSAQPDGDVDRAAAASAGVPVVRRRTGGGAVLVHPDSLVWVDVDLPADDPLWDRDVGRAFHWLGQAWAGAASDLGVDGARPHQGAMHQGRWGRLVCFAGRGPGEVAVAGRKLVGLAQRRTRSAARFQCAVLLRWDPAGLLGVLSLPADERLRAAADLGPAAVGLRQLGVGAGPEDVLDALLARLP